MSLNRMLIWNVTCSCWFMLVDFYSRWSRSNNHFRFCLQLSTANLNHQPIIGWSNLHILYTCMFSLPGHADGGRQRRLFSWQSWFSGRWAISRRRLPCPTYLTQLTTMEMEHDLYHCGAWKQWKHYGNIMKQYKDNNMVWTHKGINIFIPPENIKYERSLLMIDDVGVQQLCHFG